VHPTLCASRLRSLLSVVKNCCSTASLSLAVPENLVVAHPLAVTSRLALSDQPACAGAAPRSPMALQLDAQ
jgi:hypothetical protein